MKKSLFPSVTFVIPTYNSQSTIRMCLQSIADLDYPSSKIRVLVMDGGSQDKTIQIAKSYRFCQVHSIKTDGPEEATARGYMMVTTKYAVNFPSDNVITHTDWLRRMVAPLEANDLLVASEPWRYAYIQNDTVLNRYFALFGVNDPVAYYLGKRDRITYFENSLAFVKKRTEKKEYIQVELKKN
jgi:glycosyltransferase involved in cell wall biosynthesis